MPKCQCVINQECCLILTIVPHLGGERMRAIGRKQKAESSLVKDACQADVMKAGAAKPVQLS